MAPASAMAALLLSREPCSKPAGAVGGAAAQAAANKYDISHAKGDGAAAIAAAQFYYISGFFLTVSLDSMMKVTGPNC